MSAPYSIEQTENLKRYCKHLSAFQECGITYLLMEGTIMPSGCSSSICDTILCPTNRGDGYASRLFFAQRVTGPYLRNWNLQARLGERNWEAFSWRVENVPNLTLEELLNEHLSALVRP